MALCFSPVGNKLRVRARKFPGVVNCTAIDWFHEWPQDALESVSLRFIGEIEGVEVRNTVIQFSVYCVHSRFCTGGYQAFVEQVHVICAHECE